jgi:hypothetical protein
MGSTLLRAAVALLAASSLASAQDWPTLRGSADRSGSIDATWPSGKPARIWVRHFANERLGSAMEPIVGNGLVFIATHSGNVYALKADSGDPVWRFSVGSPILHSPCFAAGKLYVASSRERIYTIDTATGVGFPVGFGSSFSASPVMIDGTLLDGGRSGEIVNLPAPKGMGAIGVPIRQTAAAADGRAYFTGEDLRVRAFDVKSGLVAWTSEPLQGQSARDFYPVIAKVAGKTIVVVRTNPVIHHPDRLSRDFTFLCRNAGIENHWKKVDEWAKSDRTRGTPELIEKEQAAIVAYLTEQPEARTFFILDAETGKELSVPPVFWIGGCQGSGTPPVVLPDGRLMVFYRTAYTNWNHGVAPFVGLGALDIAKNRIEPLFHDSGKQPPWNTFWGTADEAQNFLRTGDALLIVHQSTLSRFDLKTRKLETLAGDRDGWGGFRNLTWAMNEWNGPGRGGVAISGKRLYWITGSRIHAYEAGAAGKPAEDVEIDGSKVAEETPKPDPKKEIAHINEVTARWTQEMGPLMLKVYVEELLSKRWAPLYVQQGIAGREFFFDDTVDLFEVLSWAFPHLPPELQKRVKEHLAAEWTAHAPHSPAALLPLNEGERREYFPVPKEVLVRAGHQKAAHPFGATYALALYAERCGEEERVRAAWPAIKANFEDFIKSSWKLDPAKGHLRANRYLASLLAFAKLAQKMGDGEAARKAAAFADETAAALAAWWKASVERSAPRVYKNISELDGFIGKGDDGLFFRIIPHNHKMALFYDLTPEVAALVKRDAPEAAPQVWKAFETLCATWWLTGEERQVHFGENFVDPPDFARDAFAAAAWIGGVPTETLQKRVDLPFCRADLTHLRKLAIALSGK